MEEMPDKKIAGFIKRHHVMTLATSAGEVPYCANVFYSYMAEENMFVFTSSQATRHGAEMLANSKVGGSIVLETKAVGKIQGVQLQGIATPAEGELSKKARRAYLMAFPYAVVADLELWTLSPTFMKLTDNRLGFGKKLIWQKEQ